MNQETTALSQVSNGKANYRELYRWLKSNDICVKNIEKNFADGVEFASLLERAFPKFVDMSLYLTERNFEGRIENWSKLNVKSLAKLGLPLDKDLIKNLANGVAGSIQILLQHIMDKITVKQPMDEADLIKLNLEEDAVFVTKVPMLLGKNKIRVKRRMVKEEYFLKLVNQNQVKEEYLDVLLEQLNDVQDKLEELQPMPARERSKLAHMINEFNRLYVEDLEDSETAEEPDEDELSKFSCSEDVHKKQPSKTFRSNSLIYKQSARESVVKTTKNSPQKGVSKNIENNRSRNQLLRDNKKPGVGLQIFTVKDTESELLKCQQNIQRSNSSFYAAKNMQKRKDVPGAPEKLSASKSAAFNRAPVNSQIQRTSTATITRGEPFKRWRP